VREIDRIEYQVKSHGEGHTCASVWLRTKDDRRVLFDAQTDADLSQQAQRIANGIHRPLRVVGDATAGASAAADAAASTDAGAGR